MDIDKMEAGRELDAAVWLALEGKPIDLLRCRYVDGDIQPHAGYPAGHISPPHYSTDIAAAWLVVEKMQWWKAENDLSEDGSVMWHFRVGEPPNHKWYSAEAPRNQEPLAICRAALKAVEAE